MPKYTVGFVGGLSAQYLRRIPRPDLHTAAEAYDFLRRVQNAIPSSARAAHPYTIERDGREISVDDLCLDMIAHSSDYARSFETLRRWRGKVGDENGMRSATAAEWTAICEASIAAARHSDSGPLGVVPPSKLLSAAQRAGFCAIALGP